MNEMIVYLLEPIRVYIGLALLFVLSFNGYAVGKRIMNKVK